MNKPLTAGKDVEPDVEVVVATQGTDLARVSTWSRKQVELVKSTICDTEGLSEDEARLFIAQCQRLNLVPGPEPSRR